MKAETSKIKLIIMVVIVFILASCDSGNPDIDYNPGAPKNIKVQTNGIDNITITWSAAQDATAYEIYYSTNAGFDINDAGVTSEIHADMNNLSKTLDGLTMGTTYYIKVGTIQAIGDNILSDEISIKVAP